MTQPSYLPLEIRNKIKEFIPRDRDLSSPSVSCLTHLIRQYRYIVGMDHPEIPFYSFMNPHKYLQPLKK